jgi:hypothetical protein
MLRADILEENNHLIPSGSKVKVYEIKQAENIILAGSEEYAEAQEQIVAARHRATDAEIERKLTENKLRILCNWLEYQGRLSVHINK